ncbi:hypothetical protein [Paraprevotella xylaniphila]|uniref:hypothetical protein n=1 Tax=Paraprevotella xylaniphila TaxID=454155 RepID=UPI003AB41CFE
MAGLRFNIDADLTRFSQLVKKIQEVRKEMEKLSKFSPKYDKLYSEFKKIKLELDTMQAKFAEIQTALAQVDISKGIVDSSKKIRHETEETSDKIKLYSESLKGVKENLKQVTQEINAMSESERKTSTGENAVRKYANLKAQIKVAADEMRQFIKEQENVIKVQRASDGSLTQLRRQLSLLTAQYDNLSRDLRNGATGKELIVQIQSVTKELSEAEQASMRFYRNVGNYASGWNGLNVQVQQLARELPSLAVSMNTFFLAISNNLPMLIDEIKLAQDRLKALKEEGKQGTQVWKQLAKSLLSWQTALVVGITLLSSYGNEIADWVKGLFKSKENVDILKESLEAYNKAVLESAKNVQEEKTRLDLLYRATQNASKPLEERKKALDELQRIYPEYFGNLSEEEILAGKASDAYIKLSKSIIAASRARAAQDMIVKHQQTVLENEQKITEAYTRRSAVEKEMENLRKKEQNTTSRPYGNIGLTIENKKIQDNLDEIDEEIAGYRQAIFQANKLSKELEDSIDVSDLLFGTSGGNGGKGSGSTGDKYLDTYQQQKAIKKSEQDILDAVTESQLNAQKMAIDLMEDGNAKEFAQINYNYDAKIEEIKKRERELLQTLQDAEYERWKQENPDYQKKGLQFTPTITALPKNDKDVMDAEYSAAYQQQQNEIRKLLSGVLAQYRDFAAQRKAIEMQFNEDISFLQKQRTDANSDEIDRAIQVAKGKMKEAVKAITDEENKALAGQDNTFLKMLFGNVSQMGFSQLSGLIGQARTLRDYLSGKGDKEGITFISPEQLKAIEESPAELDRLREALDKLLGTGKDKNKWDGIFEAFKKGFASLKGAKGFREISGSVGLISSAASQAAGEIGAMFEAMGRDRAANVVGGLNDVLDAVSNIGHAFASGGIVPGAFAAFTEIFSLFGKGAQEEEKHRQALENIMNDTIAQQREYNLLLLEQNLLYEKASTIFGVDSYAKARNAVEVLKDSVAALNSELAGDEGQKKAQNTRSRFARTINGVSGYYSKLKAEYSGLADVEIKTGSYTTGAWFWKKQHDVYSSVLDVYPDLIDANGEFNKELAETVVNTREMSEEDKAALQNMIDIAGQAEEAFEALNDYMTDIFGDLGNTMSDALVDSFKNGTDAAESFSKSVSGMLETLAEQMVYSVTLSPLLEEAQDEMMKVMKNTGLTDEQKFKQWTNILNGLVGDAVEQQNIANQLYESYKQAAEEQGFNIFDNKTETAAQQASGAVKVQASQESVDETNGRLTAIQETGYRIEAETRNQTGVLDDIYNVLTEFRIDEITSSPTGSPNEIPDIASQTRQAFEEGYRPIVNVSFPTEQLAQLAGKVGNIERKLDDLVNMDAENTMNLRGIYEDVSKTSKQIPKSSQDIIRTIESKL